MSDQSTTIGAILEMQPGTKENPCWVNGEFTARVTASASKQAKNGNPFVAGTLADPDTNASIAFSWFGRKAFPNPGTLVLIGGNGISLGEYNGTPQLTFGKSTTCNAITTQQAPAARTHTNLPPARQPAAATGGKPFLGVTVGMAVNNACQLALEESKDPAASDLQHGSADYWRRVWNHASAILRIAAALEAGHLAPKVAQDGDPEPEPAPEPAPPPQRQAPPARPAPTRSGQAFDNDAAFDSEDVHFKAEALVPSLKTSRPFDVDADVLYKHHGVSEKDAYDDFIEANA